MTSPEFEEYYTKLNQTQKLAVDSTEGPVMVIAGPGTGKTQILTLRIANILIKTQVNPENILALTFSDSGALTMRKRLVTMIGTAGYKVEICTFHSFCNETIKKNPDNFPHLISSQNISELEQIQILENIMSQTNLTILKPFGEPLYYIKAILFAINELKKEGITAQVLNNGLKKQQKYFYKIKDLYHEIGVYKGQMKGKYQDLQRDIEKNKELLMIYRNYNEQLKTQKLYDYNDMLIEVISAFTHDKNLLLRLQETLQYILVDEHQDTNTAQNKLVELLASFYDNPNLFVVGDASQAIYRFQGATLENLLYFKTLYPEAVLINLEDNYRSTQTILDAASSLIKQNTLPEILGKRVELRSQIKSPEEKIKIAEFSSYHDELYFLADNIKAKVKQGIVPREISVLARNNADLFALSEVLEKLGVKYTLESDQNILKDTEIRKFITLLRTIDSFGEEVHLIPSMHIDFLKIDPLDLYRLIGFSNKQKLNLYDVMSDKGKLKESGASGIKKITTHLKLLKKWRKESKNKSLDKFLADVLKESGLLSWVLKKPNKLDILDNFTQLFENITIKLSKNPNFSLQDFLYYLDLLNFHNVLIKNSQKIITKDAVRLMTVHRSKGLEFDYVFIMQCFDGHWGNQKLKSRNIRIPWEDLGVKLKGTIIDENEDERRLFYVALTRARKGITITYSTQSLEGREQLPSQFISEIESSYKEYVNVSRFEKNMVEKKHLFLLNNRNIKKDPISKSFLNELFYERGLSVTALNNYLYCPWKYFYKNLLRLPNVKDNNLIYGTAIHQALNSFIKAKKYTNPTLKFLLSEYKISLVKQMSSQEVDLIRFLKRGEQALKGYFISRMYNWPDNLYSEVKISGVRLSSSIIINGSIDMIWPLGRFNEVAVFDFKTGRPQSRGKLEGLINGEIGDYKRQLLFYKILLDKYFQQKFNMVQGVVEFIEPDTRDKYHSESFNIHANEVIALEEKIINVGQEITNLDFWDKRCGTKGCEYCELRNIMVS